MLNLPMEPEDIRANDPGPRALFVTLTPEENLDHMRWTLSRVSGYVGVVNHMVSRDATQPVLTELKARGLLFVDARSAARSAAPSLATEMEVPRAINDRFWTIGRYPAQLLMRVWPRLRASRKKQVFPSRSGRPFP